MDQTRQMRHYLKQIKKLIPSDYAGRKEMLTTTRRRIRNYMEDHPDAGISDFEAEFGTPEEVADSFLEELSGSRRDQKLRRRNKWFIIGGCVLVILSTAVLWYTWFLIDGTIVETTETLTIYKNGPDPWEDEEHADVLTNSPRICEPLFFQSRRRPRDV